MAKCSECGFLTCRDVKSGQLLEIIDIYRLSGEVPAITAYRGIFKMPYCFVAAYYLIPEVEKAATSRVTDKINWSPFVLQVITKERVCPLHSETIGFIKYQQGFTPKEHREMMDRKFMIELEESRRKNDKKWHWIELGAIILGSGLFTLLGAWIANGH